MSTSWPPCDYVGDLVVGVAYKLNVDTMTTLSVDVNVLIISPWAVVYLNMGTVYSAYHTGKACKVKFE